MCRQKGLEKRNEDTLNGKTVRDGKSVTTYDDARQPTCMGTVIACTSSVPVLEHPLKILPLAVF